jgi:hypothetical protein
MPIVNKALNSKLVYFHNKNILFLIFRFYNQKTRLNDSNEKEIEDKRIYIHINSLNNTLSIFYTYKQIKDKKHIEAYDGYYELFFLNDDEYKLDNKNNEFWIELKLNNDITIFEYINRLVKRLKELYPTEFGKNIHVNIEE